MNRKCLLPVLLWTLCGVAGATTWDEPWQLQVATEAKTLALYRIESLKDDSATVTLLKHLAGTPTKQKIRIAARESGFGMGEDHGEQLWLEEGESYYLYLSPGPKGTWRLPTPSSGADLLTPDGQVEATYRISIHKVLVPRDVYEMTQTCIFEVMHARPCVREPVDKFIAEALAEPVGKLFKGMSESDMQRFSRQHVALETAAALQAPLPADVITRFEAEPFFHVQISLLKYLSRSPIEDRWHRIALVVCDPKQHPLVRNYGALLIGTQNVRSEAATLKGCAIEKSEHGVMLAEDIMDPRVGTAFPDDLAEYVDELLTRWKAK